MHHHASHIPLWLIEAEQSQKLVSYTSHMQEFCMPSLLSGFQALDGQGSGLILKHGVAVWAKSYTQRTHKFDQ